VTNYALQKYVSIKYINDNHLAEDLNVHDSRFEVLAELLIRIKSLKCKSAWFSTHALAAPIFKVEKVAFMLP